jgi:hypothetical protein
VIFKGDGKYEFEEGEPVMRSCWECNPAHERLKTVNTLHVCFHCGRYWLFDRFMDTLSSDQEFDAFFEEVGLKVGGSTTTIDRGYRVLHIGVERKPGGRHQ